MSIAKLQEKQAAQRMREILLQAITRTLAFFEDVDTALPGQPHVIGVNCMQHPKGNVLQVRVKTSVCVDKVNVSASSAIFDDSVLGTQSFERDGGTSLLGRPVLPRHQWPTDQEVLEYQCSCQAEIGNHSKCVHTRAAFFYLRRELRDVKNAPVWLNAGDNLYALGESWWKQVEATLRYASTIAPAAAKATRLRWRLNPSYSSMPQLEVIEQQATKEDAWTKGKTLSATAAATRVRSAKDLGERELLRCVADPFNNSLMDVLPLLVDRQLSWGGGGTDEVEVTIVQAPVQLRLEEVEGGVAWQLWMNDRQIHPGSPHFSCYQMWREPYGLVVHDKLGKSVLFCQNDYSTAFLLRSFLEASSRGTVALRLNQANQGMHILEKLERLLPVQIPVALAGEEHAVPSKPLVLLKQIYPMGLSVMLRVEREPASKEYFIPGLEPSRIRKVTAKGPVQWVRDLVAERDESERMANQLGLGEFDFVGPYEWRSRNDDLVLEWLDRLQALGDARPTVRWSDEGQAMEVLGEITAKSLRIEIENHRDWFGLAGNLRLGELEIPLIALFAALRQGSKFVALGGGKFARITDSLRKRLTMLADLAPQDRNHLQVARAASPLVDEVLGGDIPVQAAKEWRDSLRHLERLRKQTPKLPSGFKAELRDYQLTGFQWLSRLSQWGVGACLADDMGLGKTVQALAVLQQRGKGGPALIIAPTSVGDNWVREAQKFAPKLKAKLYREHERESLLEQATAYDLVIVSYQLMLRDAELFAAKDWHTLVLDEAQFIKNAHTKTAAAVRDLRADWRLALTGTPMENHLGELWSLYRTISPGLLGSWDRFRRDFGDPIQKHQDNDRREAMAHILQPFLLRRTKDAVLKELPPRTEVVVNVSLSAAERKRYDAARLAALAELTQVSELSRETDAQKRVRILSWLTKLRQLACHPKLVDGTWKKGSAKLDAFLETVADLREANHRALVFSQFVKHLDLVRAALDKQGISYQYLDGSTPASERQKRVDAFQSGAGELFLISLKAGGTGLNLTAADYVIHLDPWWNPAVEDQATDRAHRIGQTRPVTVYRLVSQETIEEQILSLHASKRELVASVLDGADRAAKLSTDELISLIRDGSVPR